MKAYHGVYKIRFSNGSMLVKLRSLDFDADFISFIGVESVYGQRKHQMSSEKTTMSFMWVE